MKQVANCNSAEEVDEMVLLPQVKGIQDESRSENVV